MRHVRAALVATTAVLSVLTLLGAVAVAAEDDTRLFVQSTGLVGTSSLTSWFGASPEPTFAVTLRNGGELPLTPTVQLEWRDGDGPATPVIVPEVGELAPGSLHHRRGARAVGSLRPGRAHRARSGAGRRRRDRSPGERHRGAVGDLRPGRGGPARRCRPAHPVGARPRGRCEPAEPLAGPEVEAQALATIHRFSADGPRGGGSTCPASARLRAAGARTGSRRSPGRTAAASGG